MTRYITMQFTERQARAMESALLAVQRHMDTFESGCDTRWTQRNREAVWRLRGGLLSGLLHNELHPAPGVDGEGPQ